MKTGDQYLKERGVVADENGTISGEAFENAGVPMVVACTGCEMTMAFPTCLVADDGYTYCEDCAPNIIDDMIRQVNDVKRSYFLHEDYEREDLRVDLEKIYKQFQTFQGVTSAEENQKIGEIIMTRRNDLILLALYGLKKLEESMNHLVQFEYHGEKSNHGSEKSAKALDSAITYIGEKLTENKFKWRHSYAWFDGSLYVHVKCNMEKIDLKLALNKIFTGADQSPIVKDIQ